MTVWYDSVASRKKKTGRRIVALSK